jgi:hypothetical protein
MTEEFESIVDLLIDGEEEEAEHHLLMENSEEQIVRVLGDSSKMNYLMKFEEYLDDHDIYLFAGWEEAQIVAKPVIDKFWTTFHVQVGKGTDLRGALRITNDKEGQNTVRYKKNEDGSYTLIFKILKRYLDQIEQQSKEKAKQIADEKMEQLG